MHNFNSDAEINKMKILLFNIINKCNNIKIVGLGNQEEIDNHYGYNIVSFLKVFFKEEIEMEVINKTIDEIENNGSNDLLIIIYSNKEHKNRDLINIFLKNNILHIRLNIKNLYYGKFSKNNNANTIIDDYGFYIIGYAHKTAIQLKEAIDLWKTK